MNGTLLRPGHLPPCASTKGPAFSRWPSWRACRGRNLAWTLTHRPPNSEQIWKQWQKLGRPHPGAPSALTECDELSAPFAFLLARLGVREAGLLWPTP